jgi:hypothetical protein
MPLPDSSEKHNDLIDLIIQSAQKTVDVRNDVIFCILGIKDSN